MPYTTITSTDGMQNHFMYHTTDSSTVCLHIENMQAQTSIVSVLHSYSSRHSTFRNKVRENTQIAIKMTNHNTRITIQNNETSMFQINLQEKMKTETRKTTRTH
jgi:hypothetical protein